MPSITDQTPRESFTVNKEVFKIAEPYAEGHVLTAGEAGALNQTFAENIRNNFAKRVEKAKEDGTYDAELFQSQIDTYADEYEFGVRASRTSGDPVMAEAMDIMRDKVRKSLLKAGHKLKDVKSAQITERAKAEFTKNSPAAQAVLELAKQRVAAAQDIADVELESA